MSSAISRIRQAARPLPISSSSFRPLASSAMNPSLPKTLTHPARRVIVPISGRSEPRDRGSRISDRTEGFLTPRIDFSGAMRRFSSFSATIMGLQKRKETVSPPYVASFRSSIHSKSPKGFEMNRNSKSFDFVRGFIEENSKDIRSGGPQFTRTETNADIVHIKLLRNNAYVVLTDSKGDVKARASTGLMKGLQRGAKVQSWNADAAAEHIGSVAKNLGVKSVVMKVNGIVYFKKKKQAILKWMEGFKDALSNHSPVIYIEDTTRLPHNGCRLRKKCRY